MHVFSLEDLVALNEGASACLMVPYTQASGRLSMGGRGGGEWEAKVVSVWPYCACTGITTGDHLVFPR